MIFIWIIAGGLLGCLTGSLTIILITLFGAVILLTFKTEYYDSMIKKLKEKVFGERTDF